MHRSLPRVLPGKYAASSVFPWVALEDVTLGVCIITRRGAQFR